MTHDAPSPPPRTTTATTRVPPPRTTTTTTTTRAWFALLRRLYLLAVASVALAAVAAFLFARMFPPPPPPGIVRSALLHLADVADDPIARATELARLRDDAGLAVTLYDGAGHLVDGNRTPPLPFVPPMPDPFDHHRGPPPPPPPDADFDRVLDLDHDHDHDHGPPPFDLGFRPHDHGPHDHGHGPHDHGPHERGPDFEPGPLSLDFSTAKGSLYVAVVETPGLGDLQKLAIVVGVVLALLGLASVPFALVLARPLAELVRATRSFGDGDVNARADLSRAGPFSDLAHAFNEMAARVTSSMKAERDLLANVSHELRTPLARIRVALDLASEDAALAKSSLTDIEGDLGELEGLVDDILTAAKLEAQPSLKIARTPLASIADEAARKFRARHPQRAFDVDTADAREIEIEADAILLRRALDNFLDNAAKYSDAAVSFFVRVIEQKRVEVVIEDRGIGISLDDQKRLFTPFFRADKSRNRSSGGVGLGLVLSKRIVEAHNGTVTLESEVGRGTRVIVALPIARS